MTHDIRHKKLYEKNVKAKINNFTDLVVWQEAEKLVLIIYKLTKNFPKDELFGLVSQLRRASLSITSNIAEGFGRYHFKDKIRFYHQARGSNSEVENLILICTRLNYINQSDCNGIIQQIRTIQQLLNGLINATGKK